MRGLPAAGCLGCLPCVLGCVHAACQSSCSWQRRVHPLHLTLSLRATSPTPLTSPAEGCYLLFDLPGQVELFTLHGSLRRILDTLTRKWAYRLTAVQLVDAHLCSDPAKYLSALLLSLTTMLHLELPQVRSCALLQHLAGCTGYPACLHPAGWLHSVAPPHPTRLSRHTPHAPPAGQRSVQDGPH